MKSRNNVINALAPAVGAFLFYFDSIYTLQKGNTFTYKNLKTYVYVNPTGRKKYETQFVNVVVTKSMKLQKSLAVYINVQEKERSYDMTKDKVFTLILIYEENNGNTMLLLEETLLTISKSMRYVANLIESYTSHDAAEIEIIPTVARKSVYSAADVRKEFDEKNEFQTHLFLSVTTDMIKKLDL